MNERLIGLGLLLLLAPCLTAVGWLVWSAWQDPMIPWWIFLGVGSLFAGIMILVPQLHSPYSDFSNRVIPPAPPMPPWMKEDNDKQSDERSTTEQGWSELLNKESNREKVQ